MRGISGRTRDTVFDADGFYPTGDLGVRDEAGYVWYQGRRDDMFKVSGATVYPSEVEAALRAIPGISQAHVTNVTRANGAEAVGALVITDLELDSIVDAAKSRLSAFKVPTAWVTSPDADTVPMTATAKVDKAKLQALLSPPS